jgi:transcriptional regulator with XRE-family HTH domain
VGTIVVNRPAWLLLAKRSAKQIHPPFGLERAFGEVLRQVRKSRSISQEALGFDSDLDRTYISLLERGLKSPTIRTVFAVANVLKIRPSDVVRRTEDLLARKRQ